MFSLIFKMLLRKDPASTPEKIETVQQTIQTNKAAIQKLQERIANIKERW